VRSTVLLLCLLVPLCVGGAASAASPSGAPSFSTWATQWKAASDHAINAALDPCQKHFVDNGFKAGACTVRNVRLVYRRITPIWGRAVDRIAQDQAPACRAAIHTYWITTRTQQAADIAYLARHAHVSVTQLNVDLTSPRFTTMNRVAANAKLRAMRICG
jgi:hypothetical protein